MVTYTKPQQRNYRKYQIARRCKPADQPEKMPQKEQSSGKATSKTRSNNKPADKQGANIIHETLRRPTQAFTEDQMSTATKGTSMRKPTGLETPWQISGKTVHCLRGC